MLKIRNTKPLINSSSTITAAAAAASVKASAASWLMPKGKPAAMTETKTATLPTATTTTTMSTMSTARLRTKTIWHSRICENHLLWIIVAVILFGYTTFGKCFSLFSMDNIYFTCERNFSTYCKRIFSSTNLYIYIGRC